MSIISTSEPVRVADGDVRPHSVQSEIVDILKFSRISDTIHWHLVTTLTRQVESLWPAKTITVLRVRFELSESHSDSGKYSDDCVLSRTFRQVSPLFCLLERSPCNKVLPLNPYLEADLYLSTTRVPFQAWNLTSMPIWRRKTCQSGNSKYLLMV